MVMNEWSASDSEASVIEGWDVFENNEYGTEIERIDDPLDGSDPVFDGDDSAITYVKHRASQGSDRHIRALALHDAGRARLGRTE